MPPPARIERMVTGVSAIDSWIDKVLSTIEQALNVSGSDGISVRRGPQGTQIGLNLGPVTSLAVVKSGGILAASGGIPGKGRITLQSFDGEHSPVGMYDDDAYTIGTEDIDDGSQVIVARAGRYWFVVVELCPAEE